MASPSSELIWPSITDTSVWHLCHGKQQQVTDTPLLIRLCQTHTTAHRRELSSLLLVRDVLHGLMVPIVELFDKASAVAAEYTHATNVADLELAFADHARTTFVWLHCFLSADKEREWCYTTGCPACVVEHALSSESSIQLLHAACLLSDVHYPFTFEGPTLPSFMFFLRYLEHAVGQDEIWGPASYERIQFKATATRDGIEELVHQCLEIDLLLSQDLPLSTTASTPELSLSTSPELAPLDPRDEVKMKRSEEMEEEQHITELMRTCWTQMQPDATPAQSLKAKLKTEIVVQVDEVLSEG